MKIYTFTFRLFVLLTLAWGSQSCSDYLDQTPASVVSENQIFATYNDFQGFIDPMYAMIIDYNQHSLTTSMCIGGEVIAQQGQASATRATKGEYRTWISNQQSNFFSTENHPQLNIPGTGIWPDSWRGIRRANLALNKLSLLISATEEQKKLIEGQARFFRAFFHWELIRNWGGMPYVDTYLEPTDNLKLPRLNYQQTTDKLVEDLDKAAALLPEDWDLTGTGGATKGFNAGRITKGAALALKAKALLYAGSPLMNKFSTGSESVNKAYMQQAAIAAWQVIELANKGIYALVPMTDYQRNFATNDGTMTWTKETILAKIPTSVGSGVQTNRHGRIFTPARWEGNAICETVNQLYVDRFEMADGTRYQNTYDANNAKRWEGRDPRFRASILVDRDKWGTAKETLVELFKGGLDETEIGVLTPYLIKKFWPKGVNKYDKQWIQYRYSTPHIRLAEVYLIYAEAVSESASPTSTAPGATLTAVDAINVVRQRAGMPPVTALATGYASFRDLLLNERFVELCFEGHWWYDIRRWYLGHLPEYKDIVDLAFDKDWKTFSRIKIATRVFENPQHYWMPLPIEQTQLYEEFAQNPGW